MLKDQTETPSQRKTSVSKKQIRVFRAVQGLFHGQDVMMNYVHHDMRFERTDRKMELDIFVPNLSLAFEYHGKRKFKRSHKEE